jgi:hypothetical protein
VPLSALALLGALGTSPVRAAEVRPPTGVHVGVGAGLGAVGGSSYGSSVGGTGFSVSTWTLDTASAIALRAGKDFAFEPVLELNNFSSQPQRGVEPGSDNDRKEISMESHTGLAMHVRLADRGPNEIVAIIGGTYDHDTTTITYGTETDDHQDETTLSEGWTANLGFGIQHWLLPELSIRGDVFAPSLSFRNETDSSTDTDRLISQFTFYPIMRLMIHVWW